MPQWLQYEFVGYGDAEHRKAARVLQREAALRHRGQRDLLVHLELGRRALQPKGQ